MSTNEERLEQLVAEMLQDSAPVRPPTGLVSDAERAVDDTRRWPRQWATLREPPMRYGSSVVMGSATARWAVVLAATFLLVLATVGAGIAGANLLAGSALIIVDQTGGGDVTTITEAVAMADDGDEILVRPGTYVEAVVLDKDIDLAGDGPREEIVWSAPGNGPTRQVNTSAGRPYAVLLDDTGSMLSGLTLEGLQSAIHIDGGAPVLEQLAIDGVGEPHTAPTESSHLADAIAITGPSRAIVRESILTASGAITVYDGAEPLLEDNELVDGPSIIALDPGDGMVVRGNDITGPIDRAIGVFGPSRITVEQNRVVGAGGAGISVGYSGGIAIDPILRDNTIDGASIGIDVASGAAPVIETNTIRGSGTGISAGVGTDDLLATGNRLHDNDLGILVTTSAGHFEANEVEGGTTGIVVANGGQPAFVDNTVQGSERVGFSTDRRSTPVLTGNRICSQGDQVVVDGEPSDEFDATNDICEDAQASIVVDQSGDGDVTKIAEAVAMAGDGDTILIRPGTYVEGVAIDKDIRLIGDGPRSSIVLTAPEDGPRNPRRARRYALLLNDVAATISGLTLAGVDSAIHIAGGTTTLSELAFDGVGEAHTRPRGRGAFADAVAMSDGAETTVADSTFIGGGPIVAYEDVISTIEGNTLVDGPSIHVFRPADGSVVRGNTVSGSRVRGIGVYGGPSQLLIEDNTIDGSDAEGIQVGIGGGEGGNDALVRGNQVSGALIGISAAADTAPTVSGNTLTGNELGISVMHVAPAALLSDNTLADNGIGVAVEGGASAIEGNQVSGGLTGISISGSSGATLTGNSVEGASATGLSIDSSSAGVITSNDICGNAANLDVAAEAEAQLRADNEICEDAATE